MNKVTLLKKYFDIDKQEPIQDNFDQEIKEEDSESSENSIKKINTTDAKIKNSIDIPKLNTKAIDNKSSNNFEIEHKRLAGSQNKEYINREEGLSKFMFSSNNYLNSTKSNNNKMLTKDNNLEQVNMILREKSNKMMPDNPYSDSKTRTTYAWNIEKEVFQGVKGSQNLYNNSIKKKNYFYPHVGAGGGAGGMRTYKWRDATPMKFTLTTMSHSTNNTQNETNSISKLNMQIGSSYSRVKAKAMELKIMGGSIPKKENNHLTFPKVSKQQSINTKVGKYILFLIKNVFRMMHLLNLQEKLLNWIKLK